jgi:hypothetical protein
MAAEDRLTDRERREFGDIESRLHHDLLLRYRLAVLGLRVRLAGRLLRGRVLAGFALVSLALLVAGLITSEPPVIWAFAVCWPLTGVLALLMLRRLAGGPRAGPPRPFL